MFNSIKTKKDNINRHQIEAEFYDATHPEIFNDYEFAKTKKMINYIAKKSKNKNLCIDVGAGTGFLTSFELPIYEEVIAADISKDMLKMLRRKFRNYKNLHLVVCDAENLPFKEKVADLISMSSALHHLPRPYTAIKEMSIVLNDCGFLYITHEPNDIHYTRIIYLLKFEILMKVFRIFGNNKPKQFPKLNHYVTDVQTKGFNVQNIERLMKILQIKPVHIEGYYWLTPDITHKEPVRTWLVRLNFLLEHVPLLKKFALHISILCRKCK